MNKKLFALILACGFFSMLAHAYTPSGATAPLTQSAAGVFGCPTCATIGTSGGNLTGISPIVIGSTGQVSINNASNDGVTKGAAAFNATNFLASAGVINTAQNINTGASPTFVGMTLSGSAGGGTQCLQISNTGVIAGTGTACGAGGGGITALTGDVTAAGSGSVAAVVARINGVTLGTTTATSGNILIGQGSSWLTKPVSGDVALTLTGATTVGAINGVALGATTATSGNFLIGSGTQWVTHAITGDVAFTSAGVATVGAINTATLGVTTATSGNLLVGQGTSWVSKAITGDIAIGSTGAMTLATVNTNVGSFTNANITVNGKGLITAASNGSGGGGGAVTLGTTTSINNPSISGDLLSGLNSTAAQTIGIAISSTQMMTVGTSTVTGVPQVAINGAINYTQNTDPVLMPHFRKCMTNVNTGNTGGANGGRCRVLGIGASVDYGYGSQAGGSDVKTYAWLNQLARYLHDAYQVPADFNGEIGNSDNSQYNTTSGADPRWTSLTGFTNSTSNLTLGGQFFMLNANTVTANYLPDQAWDTAKIWISKYTGGPTIGLAVDSGSVTTVNTNATAVVAATTMTAPACTNGALTCAHTLNITCNSNNCSTAQGFITGHEFFDSTHPGISVLGAGAYGDTTTNIISVNPNAAVYNATAVIQTLAPDVVIFGGDMLANDAAASIPVATTRSNLITLFTAITAQSDLVCVTMQHATTPYSDATMMPYMQAMISACKQAGGVIADNWSAMNSYSPFTITSGGLNWSFDTAHLTLQGYNDWAANVAYTLFQAVHPHNGMRPALEVASKNGDVNNLRLTGAVTGSSPILAAQGTDANVGLNIIPKGTEGIGIGTSNRMGEKLLVNGAAAAGPPLALTIATATFTPLFNSQNDFTIGLTSACPCTVANPSGTVVPGQGGVIWITQDATGSRTIGTWGSSYVTAGGVSTLTLSTAANAIDGISYKVKDATHIVLTPVLLNVTH